jgi:pimeloyl-ACP methyl ester carboxylesterase
MFKTPAGQARYFAAYDATMALWSVPVTALEVPTRFGTTHVNACGADDAPPLVLLHGAAISSTMWYPNAAALSRSYRVYAPDIIGEMGKSVRAVPAMKPAAYIDWLNDLFDGLGLAQAHVGGISLGGWLAIQLAHMAPQRVMKLVLLSPASLLSIRPLFYLRVAAAILVPFLSPETRQALFLGVASPQAGPAVRQLMTPTDFKYTMAFPAVNKDQELKQIHAPTLLLVGGREVIYDPKAAIKRAIKLIPHIEAELISGAGHALNLDQPEMVNQRLLAFLEK